jgi:hypothetical protein
MDPDSNRFVPLTEKATEEALAEHLREREKIQEGLLKVAGTPDPGALSELVLPDGKPVPKHWAIFAVGEDVVIKGYTFRVAYIGETAILFEPVGLPIVGDKT